MGLPSLGPFGSQKCCKNQYIRIPVLSFRRVTSRRPKIGPDSPQTRPKEAPDGPKMGPRRPQTGPGKPQGDTRQAPDSPGMPQTAPRRAQEGPRRAPDGPRRPQTGPQTSPDGPGNSKRVWRQAEGHRRRAQRGPGDPREVPGKPRRPKETTRKLLKAPDRPRPNAFDKHVCVREATRRGPNKGRAEQTRVTWGNPKPVKASNLGGQGVGTSHVCRARDPGVKGPQPLYGGPTHQRAHSWVHPKP